MSKKASKEEICWLVANEYYEVLTAKKKGIALRKHIHEASDKFISAMEKLRTHT